MQILHNAQHSFKTKIYPALNCNRAIYEWILVNKTSIDTIKETISDIRKCHLD